MLQRVTGMRVEVEWCERDEQKCTACDNRFICWTTRTLSFPIVHLDISKSNDMRDYADLEAGIPNGFKCGNLLGSKAMIYSEHSNEIRTLLNGIITTEAITQNDAKQMRIILRVIGDTV